MMKIVNYYFHSLQAFLLIVHRPFVGPYKPKKSPKPPKVEKSSQPKPPIILKKKAEESLETALSSTLNVTPSKGSIG